MFLCNYTRRVFENRVQRRIYEPKRDKITGEWRKLRNCPGDQIRKNEIAGPITRMGERIMHVGLVGKPEGKSHLGDPGVDGRIILR